MICDFAEIVVVPFPFVDVSISKRRPALVISSRPFNEAHGQSVLAMITTGAASSWPSDHPINGIRATGLTHASGVRWKLFTLPNSLIARRLGALDRADRTAIAKAARSYLAA